MIDLAAGRAVLAASLPKALKARGAQTIEDLGWRAPNKSTLLIPMKATFNGSIDEYLLKLTFKTDEDWPPSAQFVNPKTNRYVLGLDRHHIPKLTSQEVHTHDAYPHPAGGAIQLICCSATFEYYDVLHGLNAPHHLWRTGDSFLVTVNAIERAMANHYQGRFEPND